MRVNLFTKKYHIISKNFVAFIHKDSQIPFYGCYYLVSEDVIKMDATTITRVMKELMKLLPAGEDYDYEMVEYEVEVLKEELGSWFIEDYKLYVGS